MFKSRSDIGFDIKICSHFVNIHMYFCLVCISLLLSEKKKVEKNMQYTIENVQPSCQYASYREEKKYDEERDESRRLYVFFFNIHLTLPHSRYTLIHNKNQFTYIHTPLGALTHFFALFVYLLLCKCRQGCMRNNFTHDFFK